MFCYRHIFVQHSIICSPILNDTVITLLYVTTIGIFLLIVRVV